jgi:hypothetical protein
MPLGWAILIVLLWLAVIALAVVVLGTLRQLTPLLERAAAQPPPRRGEQGPSVGEQLPGLPALDRTGVPVAARPPGRPGVFLLLSSSCGPCLELAAELGRADLNGLGDALTVVTDPDSIEALGLPPTIRVLTLPDGGSGEPLNVYGRPFAITADAAGVVRGKQLLNTVDQLTDLAGAVLPA